jgi:hypothetical protein
MKFVAPDLLTVIIVTGGGERVSCRWPSLVNQTFPPSLYTFLCTDMNVYEMVTLCYFIGE